MLEYPRRKKPRRLVTKNNGETDYRPYISESGRSRVLVCICETNQKSYTRRWEGQIGLMCDIFIILFRNVELHSWRWTTSTVHGQCSLMPRSSPDEASETLQPTDETRLVNFLLTRLQFYGGNLVRPVLNVSQPVEVEFELSLYNILKLDEKNGVLTTATYISMVRVACCINLNYWN